MFLFFVCRTFVIAAVSVVLPWSMCPIVPMFTCGFVRSYFALPIRPTSASGWSPCPGLNRRPRPYQGRALPTELHGHTRYRYVARRSLARSACAECPQAEPRASPTECPQAQSPASRSGHPRLERHAHSSIQWSGKRDSNPRPPAWKAGALPLSYSRPDRWWGGEDLNPRRRTPADLQSAPFGHLGTSPNLPACE